MGVLSCNHHRFKFSSRRESSIKSYLILISTTNLIFGSPNSFDLQYHKCSRINTPDSASVVCTAVTTIVKSNTSATAESGIFDSPLGLGHCLRPRWTYMPKLFTPKLNRALCSRHAFHPETKQGLMFTTCREFTVFFFFLFFVFLR
jgi:hypothetical protein